MRLLMVRHGETLWNSERRLQGQADAPLSPKGRAQAAALASVFANGLSPDVVVSSDLPRAKDTAAILGFPDARLDPRLREIDVGAWTAELIADIQHRDPDGYRGWRAGTHTPAGGESWVTFRARIRDALDSLARHYTGTALVIAHGGVIRAACETLVGLAPANVVPVGPATITIFDIAHTDGTLTARLEGYNLAPTQPHLDAPD